MLQFTQFVYWMSLKYPSQLTLFINHFVTTSSCSPMNGTGSRYGSDLFTNQLINGKFASLWKDAELTFYAS